jgi:hypothetical protein
MANLSWASVQEARNYLLKQSDWTQLLDVPLSEEEKEKWVTYRQELRDITKTFRAPEQVIWPVPPDLQSLNES